jgi:hypothetical protein
MFSPPPPELAAVFNDPKPEWATTTFSQPWNTLKEVLIHPRKEAFNLLLTDQ